MIFQVYAHTTIHVHTHKQMYTHSSLPAHTLHNAYFAQGKGDYYLKQTMSQLYDTETTKY